MIEGKKGGNGIMRRRKRRGRSNNKEVKKGENGIMKRGEKG